MNHQIGIVDVIIYLFHLARNMLEIRVLFTGKSISNGLMLGLDCTEPKHQVRSNYNMYLLLVKTDKKWQGLTAFNLLFDL